MWVCPQCGEPHQDQFKECWKCVGAEMDEQMTAERPKLASPVPSRQLRSFGSVLLRSMLGFGVGTFLGVALFHRYGVSLQQASIAGVGVGLVFGVIVGIFVWVAFPFEPLPGSDDAEGQTDHSV